MALFAFVVSVGTLLFVLHTTKPVAVALPYRILDPMVVYFDLPMDTTWVLDDETVTQLVRDIHARRRDAAIQVCVPPRVWVHREDKQCYVLYYELDKLSPDTGKRGAHE